MEHKRGIAFALKVEAETDSAARAKVDRFIERFIAEVELEPGVKVARDDYNVTLKPRVSSPHRLTDCAQTGRAP